MIEIFCKDYDGESLYDLGRDVSEAICEDYNEIMKELPTDEHGFTEGVFTVTIIWEAEE